RTRGSNGVNDVAATGARSYLGGSLDATARPTVLREIPNRSAIRVFGTPSAANLRINAQSSKVITLQSSSAHFPSGRTAQSSAGADTCNSVLCAGEVEQAGEDSRTWPSWRASHRVRQPVKVVQREKGRSARGRRPDSHPADLPGLAFQGGRWQSMSRWY